MQWQDEAIILTAHPHGEHHLIVQLFTHQHGVHGGILRGRKQAAPVCQPGNHVQARWNARLQQHLGMFQLELLHPYAARVMTQSARIAALAAMMHWLRYALPERDPHAQLFEETLHLLDVVTTAPVWLPAYLRFELCILHTLGCGLDLHHCAGGGAEDELVYISPKSGRAVSRAAGAPYHAQLLPLPDCLRAIEAGDVSPHITPESLRQAWRVCEYFLDKWLVKQHTVPMPPTRATVYHSIAELADA